MLSLGPLAFLNPWLLAALAALPVLWILLRATPPSPRRLGFPGVRLLLGLEDAERTPDRTPWWLLALRCVIAAAAIAAFAQPVLNPKARLSGSGPLLIAMDGGWADAPDWEARRARALETLAQAERAGRPVVFASLAAPAAADAPLDLRPAAEWRGEIEALQPRAWAPKRDAFAARLAASDLGLTEAVWIRDGLSHGDAAEAGDERLGEALAALGGLTVIEAERSAQALSAPALVDGRLTATALRATAPGEETVRVVAFGAGEDGATRRLGQAEATFAADATTAEAAFDLPLELRNRVTRVQIAGVESAGAVALADDGVRRRRAGLVSGGSEVEAQRLVSDLHYIRAALSDAAEVVEGEILDVVAARPDAVFLADVGRFTDAERDALVEWVEAGGLLVRFAGPRMARGTDALGFGPAAPDDPLLPVALRAGGRAVGGAMAWGEPQRIRPFVAPSPFAGIETPEDVTVSRQILAQLGPDLPQRTWAALEDGTPLVTSAAMGDGRVALFHVTANAEWSSLPLSGLFVEMAERLLLLAGGVGAGGDAASLEGRTARPAALLDGFGRLSDAEGLGGFAAERLLAPPGPDAPPGIYRVGEAARAYNLFDAGATLSPAAPPPFGAARETLDGASETPLSHWLLALAVTLLALDTVVSLALSGRLPRLRPRRGAAALALVAAMAAALAAAPGARAQGLQVDDAAALRATLDTVLAHVLTGDAEVDALAAAGLDGLSRVLTARTAIEPAAPIGVNLETDELAFFPLLYWPITPGQPTPSDEAAARLNAYMRTGGMIVFDTRDRHLDFGGRPTPQAEALRRLTARLDLPPLEPTPHDHVLTRAFYLLEDFPGRWSGGRVWVEAAPDPDEEALDGAPFRNLNDGVSPVVVGGADWAAAWAADEEGQFLAPIDGAGGWRQREMAYRFGINLVMYALTGNYKSDQVHVPALLERLGQ
ncbi:MAG: DUF4159 domain-containing protein [Rhodobacteraceae bacterium]|nr:MAG: DUF4159 domain-containing protein [Paracoccaceae bacterium]